LMEWVIEAKTTIALDQWMEDLYVYVNRCCYNYVIE